MDLIRFNRLEWADREVSLPHQATPGSTGLDIYANLPPSYRDKGVYLNPRDWNVVPTGFTMDIPIGMDVQIRSRSGLSVKYGVVVLNAPGTIDSDYKEEVEIVLLNHGTGGGFRVDHGTRIAQMVVSTYILPFDHEVPEPQVRIGGFGSTGER